mmetsp:Transcript_64205/g.122483  ORF Transcript_64205/g.122483 Transcript_64205/m.122483 type:complete len:80 (+) Transcript_64205:359-598(+)
MRLLHAGVGLMAFACAPTIAAIELEIRIAPRAVLAQGIPRNSYSDPSRTHALTFLPDPASVGACMGNVSCALDEQELSS